MDELDKALMQLRSLPVPSRLATLEADVMARIDAEQRVVAVTTGPALALAGIVALSIGMAGAILPGGAAQAAPSPALGFGANLAPSTLLASVG